MKKRNQYLTCVLGAIFALVWAGSAAAQDDKDRAVASSPSFDHWQVRTTANGFFFDASSGILDLDVENTADFAFDVTYFLTRNLAIQVLATYINTQVQSKAASALLGGTPNDNVGAVDLLPPIVTAQWHFTNFASQGVEPYVGIGFNYNHFGNESGQLRALGASVDDQFGFVTEVGSDIALSRIAPGLYANVNFKYLYTKTDVKVDSNHALDDKLKINAYILGAGVGYRF